MFKLVSVLVPTRGRPAQLNRLLESWSLTTAGCSELVFRADEDDAPTLERLKDWPHKIVGPRKEGYASLPAFFNELHVASAGDVLMVANDDVVFVTPGWDARILEEANKYPDGLFDFGVDTHNAANFPLACVSRRMADKVGFLFDPRFFWGDIFWRDVASRFGRAVPLPDVRIDHEWMGFTPDRVFLAGQAVRTADHSRYHAQAVEEAVEKLRTM